MTDLRAVARAYVAGAPMDWSALHRQRKPRRVPLPTYPFERECFELAVRPESRVESAGFVRLTKNPDVAHWFYVPAWKTYLPPAVHHEAPHKNGDTWLVFHDGGDSTNQIVSRLKALGHECVQVRIGSCFSVREDGTYTIDPAQADDYKTLLSALRREGLLFNRVAHFMSCHSAGHASHGIERFDHAQKLGFYSLTFLVQAISAQEYAHAIDIKFVTRGLHALDGRQAIAPEAATAVGLCKVITQEFPTLTCVSIDLPAEVSARLAVAIADELVGPSRDPVVALCDKGRSILTFEPVQLPSPVTPLCIRERGVYVITGGLGSVGGAFAEYLANSAQARLVLTSRSPFPEREEWDDWLRSHEDNRAMAKRIRKLQRLEVAGARTLVLQADAGDVDAMTRLLDRAEEDFGVWPSPSPSST